MYELDRQTAFSNEGFRVRRNNPDGSLPTVDKQLGFLGTVDLSELLASSVLSYRLGGQGDFTDLVIDLTGVGVDNAAATVAELVTALNLDAGFSAVFTAEADTTTGRLNIKETAGTSTYLELKGLIAIVLGIGSYNQHSRGFGTHFVDCFDNSAALSLAKEIKDFEEIEVESGKGNLTTMTIAALLKGLNPVINLVDELFELKVLIQGGEIETVDGVSSGRYVPPTTDQVYLPVFSMEIYEAKYNQGSNLRTSIAGYKRLNLNNCNGTEADLGSEVKSWATYAFNVRVREYTDDSGTLVPGYTEDPLTISEFDALGVA